MSRHYIYAYATDNTKSGARNGSDSQIHTRTGKLLTPKGYENLRRNTVRSRTVFQLWGKQRPSKRAHENRTQLTVMLQIYDLKTVVIHDRHILLLDVVERDHDENIVREEKRVLSPYEACRWLNKHHREDLAHVLFPGKKRKLSRQRINFNSHFLKLRTAPSSIFASLLNIIVILLFLLMIPLIIIIVSISLEIEDVGKLDRPEETMAVATNNPGLSTIAVDAHSNNLG